MSARLVALLERFDQWNAARADLSRLEENDEPARASRWEDSDDAAVRLLEDFADTARSQVDALEADPVTLTLTRDQLEYLSCLVDMDDDPENAIGCGYSLATWVSARAVILTASSAGADQ